MPTPKRSGVGAFLRQPVLWCAVAGFCFAGVQFLLGHPYLGGTVFMFALILLAASL
jgi:hypothetical protein